jgi:hypothetical protein
MAFGPADERLLAARDDEQAGEDHPAAVAQTDARAELVRRDWLDARPRATWPPPRDAVEARGRGW